MGTFMHVANKEWHTKQYLITVPGGYHDKTTFHFTPEFNDETKEGVVETDLWECGAGLDFVHFSEVSNGDLRSTLKDNPPKKFTIEIWEVVDGNDHKWQHTQNMTFNGVVWGKSYHTNPGDSACSCVAHFTYFSRSEESVKDGRAVDIPLQRHKYPHLQLRKVLQGFE